MAEAERSWDADELELDVRDDKRRNLVPKKNHGPAFMRDATFFRSVISFAGWALILSISSMFLLAIADKKIPEGIVAAASGLVGLLAGIFAVKGSESSGADEPASGRDG